ncbi:MAG TPA: MOSC domain-containing protein [Acidimicrobiia bacterium]|jgi:MOSC domain-containing protein YiiM
MPTVFSIAGDGNGGEEPSGIVDGAVGLTSAMSGVVHQINMSDGGVPKRPVDEAFVNVRGLVGDRQTDRKHHGHPSQALCLYSFELIEALQAEGHSIEPGFAGENLTLRDVRWETLGPGTRVHIGADVVAEVTDAATPCAKQSRWFADRNYRRIDEEANPGWNRWYARVVAAGTVRTGDLVVVVDPGAEGDLSVQKSRRSRSS